MNERRQDIISRNNGFAADSFEQEWQELECRLSTLAQQAKVLNRLDLLSMIIKQQTVMRRNKPNKKVFNSVQKQVERIETLLSEHGARTR